MRKEWLIVVRQSFVLARANLASRYRMSFAGYLWVILNPLLLFATQAYVFRVIFRIQVEHYFLFLLFGLVPWIYFSQTIEMSVSQIYSQGRLLKSMRLHPFALILAQGLENMVNAASVFGVALILLSAGDAVPWGRLWPCFLPLASVGLITVALGFLLAILQVFFHDMKFIVSFALNILFYLSPVVYPESFVPAPYRAVLRLNPLAYVLRPFRALLDHGASKEFWMSQLAATALAGVLVVAAVAVWRAKKNEIYLRL